MVWDTTPTFLSASSKRPVTFQFSSYTSGSFPINIPLVTLFPFLSKGPFPTFVKAIRLLFLSRIPLFFHL